MEMEWKSRRMRESRDEAPILYPRQGQSFNWQRGSGVKTGLRNPPAATL